MTILIACLSTGKGTWIDVNEVIDSEKWEKIYLITNEFGKDKFKTTKNIDFIIIDPESSINQIKSEIVKKVNIADLEVALSIISGSGKEHTAVISAILSKGLGIRYVAVEDGKLIDF